MYLSVASKLKLLLITYYMFKYDNKAYLSSTKTKLQGALHEKIKIKTFQQYNYTKSGKSKYRESYTAK